MRDSTNPADIPVQGTDLAAGYVNGPISQWPANGWDRFPSAGHVTIDVIGDRPDADCLDIETGDATNATAVNWVRAKLARHDPYLPVLYSNRANLTPLFNALLAAGFHVNQHFKLWIATLDGTKSVADMTGVTAVQYAGEAQTGGHYDESIVYDDAWKQVVAPPTYFGLLVKGGPSSWVTQNVTSHDGKNWS
jgi:hypothetical protein